MKKVKIRVITVKFGRRTIALLWFATQLTRAIIQEVQFCSKIKISKKKSMTASSTLWKSWKYDCFIYLALRRPRD